MAHSGLGVKELNFPLMALVDFRGFRLVAISVLPISKKSLIYGSNDAGSLTIVVIICSHCDVY